MVCPHGHTAAGAAGIIQPVDEDPLREYTRARLPHLSKVAYLLTGQHARAERLVWQALAKAAAQRGSIDVGRLDYTVLKPLYRDYLSLGQPRPKALHGGASRSKEIRAAVVAHHFEGMPTAEIAELFGWREAKVQRLLQAATEKIRLAELTSVLAVQADAARVYQVTTQAWKEGKLRRRRLVIAVVATLCAAGIVTTVLMNFPSPVPQSLGITDPSASPSPALLGRCGVTKLALPPGSWVSSTAQRIDPSGKVVGGIVTDASGKQQAVLWNQGKPQLLTISGSQVEVRDVSASGSLVAQNGAYTWVFANNRYFKPFAEAVAINDIGRAVGHMKGKAAILYEGTRHDGPILLGSVNQGNQHSTVIDIDEHSTAVGVNYEGDSTIPGRLEVWHKGGSAVFMPGGLPQGAKVMPLSIRDSLVVLRVVVPGEPVQYATYHLARGYRAAAEMLPDIDPGWTYSPTRIPYRLDPAGQKVERSTGYFTLDTLPDTTGLTVHSVADEVRDLAGQHGNAATVWHC